MTEPSEHWQDNTRDDGVRVYSWTSQISRKALWGVKGPDGTAITLCPCCGYAIETQRAAQLIADAAYPHGD